MRYNLSRSTETPSVETSNKNEPLYTAIIIQNIAMIIAGIASIAVACSWPKGTARVMFILFIVASLLILPAISFVGMVPSALSSQWGYNASLWIHYLYHVVGFLSLVPLLIFVTSAKQMFTGHASAQLRNNNRVINAGPVWDTNHSKAQIKQISTKRNLAFVIDMLPLMLVLIGSFYLVWMTIDRNGIRPEVAGLCQIGTVFAWLYLMLKETYRGQSIGKWLLGCRVVSAQTGQPIGAGMAILRNLIFMLPLMPLVELIVSKCRDDGKRLGDLWAETVVVAGPPQWIDGVVIAEEVSQKKHPLDD